MPARNWKKRKNRRNSKASKRKRSNSRTNGRKKYTNIELMSAEEYSSAAISLLARAQEPPKSIDTSERTTSTQGELEEGAFNNKLTPNEIKILAALRDERPATAPVIQCFANLTDLEMESGLRRTVTSRVVSEVSIQRRTPSGEIYEVIGYRLSQEFIDLARRECKLAGIDAGRTDVYEGLQGQPNDTSHEEDEFWLLDISSLVMLFVVAVAAQFSKEAITAHGNPCVKYFAISVLFSMLNNRAGTTLKGLQHLTKFSEGDVRAGISILLASKAIEKTTVARTSPEGQVSNYPGYQLTEEFANTADESMELIALGIESGDHLNGK